jgi:EmrB/QacA subfamily drug resistance transporter
MPAPYVPSRARWWTLAVVSIGTFMLMLDLSVVAVALPQIRSSLDASFAQLQWVVDAYALLLAAALVTAGSLGDRRGRKRLFLAGFALFTLASLACGLAGTATVLDISRGVQGVGAAILFATGPALLGHGFHGKERAAAFGVFGAATGLAIAAGPLTGGALTGIGWRWIFFINIPVGLVAMAVAARRVPESRDPHSRQVDWVGMVLFTLALTALVFAVIRGNEQGWGSARIVAAFAAGGVLLLAFLAVEARLGERAMFDLAFFRNPTFVGISLVALIANGAGLPSVFIETNYVENLMHLDAWGAGLRFLPLTLALFVFGAVGGGLTGKVPFRALLTVACLALGVGLLLTRLAGADSAWTALIPSMIVTGAGMGLFNPTRAALAIGIAEPARAGVASGINETFQQVGTAVGIAGIGALFANRVGAAFAASPAGRQLGDQAAAAGRAISAGSLGAVPPAATSSARTAFVVGFHDAMTLCALCAFAAAVIAVTLLRTRDLHSTALSLIPPEDSRATDSASASDATHIADEIAVIADTGTPRLTASRLD